MKNMKVTLSLLTEDDREQFILDNQWAFKYGAMMEFGERDNHTLTMMVKLSLAQPLRSPLTIPKVKPTA